jgi:hypothetical protein
MTRLPIAFLVAAWGVITCGQRAFLQSTVVSQAKSIPGSDCPNLSYDNLTYFINFLLPQVILQKEPI